jgi:hypothetical protein
LPFSGVDRANRNLSRADSVMRGAVGANCPVGLHRFAEKDYLRPAVNSITDGSGMKRHHVLNDSIRGLEP